jgi:hypothetical protein
MAVAPHSRKASAAVAITYLLSTSEVYQLVVQDTVATIQDTISNGVAVEHEVELARRSLAPAAGKAGSTQRLSGGRGCYRAKPRKRKSGSFHNT